jgi:hypothetical protein
MTTASTRFSEPEMNDAFRRVQDPSDWRAPIDRVVTIESFRDVDLICDAVEFYTATKAETELISTWNFPAKVRFTAKGYRAGPAGP